MQPLDSVQTPSPPEADEPDKASSAKAASRALRIPEWELFSKDLTLYERVLVSIIAVSYAQSPSTGGIEEYLRGITAETRMAFADRAQAIVSKYGNDTKEQLQKEEGKNTWVEAARFGLSAYLEDFADAQSQSFRSLDQFVRDRTSLKTQILLAFGVALFLAIFVGAVRTAVTPWDDIKPQPSFEKKGPSNDSQNTHTR